MNLEGVAKMAQVSNKGCILFESSREGVKSRLRGGFLRAPKRPPWRLYGVLYSRGLLRIIERGKKKDYGFVKNTISIDMTSFWGIQSCEFMLKVGNTYHCGGSWFITEDCLESRIN